MTRVLTLLFAAFAFATGILANGTAEARSLICTLGESMKAVNGDVKSSITFTNRTKSRQKVYWVDYDGKRHNYQELSPGETYDQPTFMTHPWVVTNEDGKCLGVYLPERQKITVEAGAKAKKTVAVKRQVTKPKPVAKIKKKKKTVRAEPRETVSRKKNVETAPLPEPLPSEDHDVERDDRVASLGDEYEDQDYRDDDGVRRTVKRKLNDDEYEDDTYDEGVSRDEDVSRKKDRTYDDDDQEFRDLDSDLDSDDEAYRSELEPLKRRTTRSWECGAGGSLTEEAICQDRTLTRLDNELNELYGNVLSQVRPRGRRRLRLAQQEWLQRRERCGARVRCIRNWTERRLSRLNQRLERVINRRNVRRRDDRWCEDGFVTADGRCRRAVVRPGRIACGPGRIDNGRGRCVRRSKRKGIWAFDNGQRYNGVPN